MKKWFEQNEERLVRIARSIKSSHYAFPIKVLGEDIATLLEQEIKTNPDLAQAIALECLKGINWDAVARIYMEKV